ncbi:MAG: hypothetical protein EDX89_23535 [Acidobacteria bacterium]|nr:MAG: hypothetical protein EDX89_23535 [Acidobacteriota bacterium]
MTPASSDGSAPAASGLDSKKDPSRKPPTLTICPDEVPIILAAYPHWIRWRWSWVEKQLKWTKVPVHPTLARNASTSNPSTWGKFETAVANLNVHGVDGVGFVFTAADPFCGIDIDSCRDPRTGLISELARSVMEAIPCYAEVSVSGTGVHVITRGSLGGRSGGKSGALEVYDRGRYFTFTGHRLLPGRAGE